MKNSLILWLLVGWVGYFILPWYLLEEGLFSFDWLFDGYPFDEDYSPAFIQVFSADKAWLLPLLISLLLPLKALSSKKSDHA